MRIVLDTNVIISAALSKNSIPFRVFEEVIELHQSLISTITFDELRETLYKPKFDKYFLPEDTRPSILWTVLRYSSVIIPTITVKVCRHNKDDKFLELALTGKADCLITGDPDWLVLNSFENIPIITPKEFLEGF